MWVQPGCRCLPLTTRHSAVLQGYAGPEALGEALKGADLVIIPAGVPRKPGMTRDDLFKVQQLHTQCTQHSNAVHV